MKITQQKYKPKVVLDMESSLESIESVDLKKKDKINNEFDSPSKSIVNQHQATASNVENSNKTFNDVEYKVIPPVPTIEVLSKLSQNDGSHMVEAEITLRNEWQAHSTVNQPLAIECVQERTVVKNNAIIATAEVNKSSENQFEIANIYENEIIINNCESAPRSAESIDHSETDHIEGIASNGEESRELQVVKVASTGEAEVTTKNTSHSISKFKNDESQKAGDFYSSELLRRKGYNLNSFNNTRQLVNLTLINTVCKTNEIQCTNLPYHMRENQLIPLFEKYGKIYELRMNLKDKNQYLSEAFVTYTTQSEAENAIISLHRREVQGQIISVAKFMRDLRVLIRPIPSSATANELLKIFKFTEGLLKVTFDEKDNKNRGFCFLHYQNYDTARNAKRFLSKKVFFGRSVTSALHSHAAREDDKKFQGQDNVESSYSRSLTKMTNQQMPNEKSDASHTLYITNLRTGIRSTDLRNILSIYGEIGQIDKDDNFASVKFRNVEDSRRAADNIDKKLLGNDSVEISHSKPVTKMTDQLVKQIPNEKSDASHTLYITNLRTGIRSTDLRNILSIYGEIGQIDKDDNFASVKFRNVEDSRRAADNIDKKLLGNDSVEISHSKPVTKMTDQLVKQIPNGKSDASHTLYITNLRTGIRSTDLRNILSIYGEIGQIDKDDNFASVKFRNVEDSRRAADNIDKKLLGNDSVEISHSKPVTKMTDQLVKQIPNGKSDASHTLYITNLRTGIRSTDLRNIFSIYGEIGQIDKDDNFASVKFRNVEDSRRAADNIDKKLLGNDNVEISHSRPATKMTHQLVKQIPNGKSDASHTLYITNLGSGIRSTDLRNILSVYGEIGQIDKDDNFASVKFRNVEDSRRAADNIDKKLLGNDSVEISHSKPVTKMTDQLVKQIPNGKSDASHPLYITNLRSGIRSTDLRNIFSGYGEIGQIDKDDNFASVKFRNVKDSTRAAHEIDKKLLGNDSVEILHLRPVTKKTGQLVKQIPNETSDNFASVKLRNVEDSRRAADNIDKKLLGNDSVEISHSKPVTKMTDQLVKQIPNGKSDASHTLYITNLRSGIRSTDLRNIFSGYGEIGQIDKDDNFASVEFRNVEDSRRAADNIDKKLLGNDNVEISHSRPATKMTHQLVKQIPDGKSDASHTLYITNLGSGIRSTDLRNILSVYGEIGQIDKDDNFASVKFRNVEDSRRAADNIDKKLLGNDSVEISHSKPVTKMTDQLVKQIPNGKSDASHTLYLTNLRSGIRSTDLRNIFSGYGEIDQIDKDDNFASVKFRNVKDSTRAAHEIDKKLLGNDSVEILHLRPVTKKTGQLVKQIPNETSDNFASVKLRNVEDSRRAADNIYKKLLRNDNVEISHSRPATKMTHQLVKPMPNGKSDASRTLYITNLSSGIRSTDLRNILSVYGEIGQIDKDDNFASVKFRNVEDSRRAADNIDKKLLGKENVQVSHSRPPTKTDEIFNELNDMAHISGNVEISRPKQHLISRRVSPQKKIHSTKPYGGVVITLDKKCIWKHLKL